MGQTTITINTELKEELEGEKRPGETWTGCLWRILDDARDDADHDHGIDQHEFADLVARRTAEELQRNF